MGRSIRHCSVKYIPMSFQCWALYFRNRRNKVSVEIHLQGLRQGDDKNDGRAPSVHWTISDWKSALFFNIRGRDKITSCLVAERHQTWSQLGAHSESSQIVYFVGIMNGVLQVEESRAPILQSGYLLTRQNPTLCTSTILPVHARSLGMHEEKSVFQELVQNFQIC